MSSFLSPANSTSRTFFDPMPMERESFSTVAPLASHGRGHRPNAVKLRHGQGFDKGFAHFRRDRELAVRLAIIGCKLGEKLVVGDTCGRGEPRLRKNAAADLLRGCPGGRQCAPILRDVEISFVEGNYRECACRIDRAGCSR